MWNKTLMFIAAATLSSIALAAEPSVTFSDLHARPTNGKVGVAFFTASSTKEDAITGVSSDCCDAVEIHRTDKFNGVMSMRRIAQLSLKEETPVRVQPDSKGGEHVMLIGLKKPLKEGDTVKVNVTFSKAPAQTITFPVQSAKADDGVHDLH